MALSKSKMRLFNGHLKMDEASLKKVFILQLNNIFAVKTYLVANLPVMAASASFVDLRFAIFENIDEIELQILRMDVMFKLIGEKGNPKKNVGIRGLVIEAYLMSKTPGLSGLETDMMILYHLNTLESIEVAYFTCLHDMAASMPNTDLTLLLKQNIDSAKDTKELYQMIIQEYLN